MGPIHGRAGTVAAFSAALAMIGAPSATALPVQDVRQGTDVSCFSSSEEVRVEVGAFFPDSGELTETWAAVYTEDFASFAYEGSGVLDGGGFSLSYSLATEGGDAVGTILVEGEVTPVGDRVSLDERFRDGNAWSGVKGTVQELLVSATITSASGDLTALAATELTCSAAEVDLVFSGTTPATRIFRGSGLSAQCRIGDDGFLSVDAFGEATFATLLLGIDWEEGTFELGAQGTLEELDGNLTGTLDVFEPFLDPPQTVAVDLAIGESVDEGRLRFKSPEGAFHLRYTDYALSGTATLPDGSGVAAEDCELRRFTYLDRFSSRAGQKPGGRAPVNDAPTGAVNLDEGATVRTSTRGAAEEAEASCVTDHELPFGRTLWYRVAGTGQEVSLTTAGSDFDTAIGVYDADSLEQIACVDDTDDGLQSSVTFATTSGSTYLVQVGGFAADWGSLVLTRS